MLGLRTLVLNGDFLPISIVPLGVIPAEDAVTRVFNETCFVVSEYEREIKTPTYKMKWPSVIARKDVAKWSREVALNNDYLYYRDHAVCAYCGERLTTASGKANTITRDHVIPLSRGGKNVWENVVASCPKCNSSKGSHSPKGLWEPRHLPYKPSYWQLVEARRYFPITVFDRSWLDFLGEWKAPVYLGKQYNVLQPGV